MGGLAHTGQTLRGSFAGGLGADSSARSIVGVIIGLLWAMALWRSWECQGLFADGAVYFLDLIMLGGFSGGDDYARAYANVVTQAPVVLAVKLGVNDLHWLARIYSLGLFGVPTALYSFALVRARGDLLVLAATLAAIAIVFMSTSFIIIAQHNTAYACAILAAVWLATTSNLRVRDGFVLVAIAALAVRSYEHFVYLGPLLGLMALWVMARAPAKPWSATGLYGIAAALFLVGFWVAAESIVAQNAVEEEQAYLAAVLVDALNFRFNIQLDLLLVAAAGISIWGLLRPDDLRGRWPYLAAGLVLLLVAASPALVVIKALVAPAYSGPQISSRTVAGPLVACFVVFVWLHASGRTFGLTAPPVLEEPGVARRLVILAAAMVVATMPWNIMLTALYKHYLEVVRTTIRAQSGLIDIEEAIFERHPHLYHNDIAPSALSVIMRTSPSDGILTNTEKNPADRVDPMAPPDVGRFVWRD